MKYPANILYKNLKRIKVKPIKDDKGNFLFNSNLFCFFENFFIASRNHETVIIWNSYIENQWEREFAVDANDLLSVLERIGDKEADFTFEDNFLIVSSQRIKIKLKLVDFDPDPLSEYKLPNKLISIPKDFFLALTRCIKTTSKDSIHPYLQCIHITKEFVESCDNLRFSCQEIDGFGEFLVPASALQGVLGVHWNHIFVHGNMIGFTSNEDGGIMAFCQTLKSDYPDLSYLALSPEECDSIQFPDGIEESIKSAGIFSLEDISERERIRIQLENSILTISSMNRKGEFVEKSRISCEGTSTFSFSVNPSFFLDLLSFSHTILINEKRDKAGICLEDGFYSTICLGV
jgi:hypothetical protein